MTLVIFFGSHPTPVTMTNIDVSRRERKKDETRERITRAALGLFSEKGFVATTVDEIAQRADVAKGTFFNYFPRKEAVLAAFADQHLSELRDTAERLIAESGRGARTKLIELITSTTAVYQRHPDVWLHTYLEFLKGNVSTLVEIDQRAQGSVRRLIEQGQAAGEIRADVSAERLAYVLRGTFFFTTLSWLYCPEMFELKDELRARLNVVLDGADAARSRS
jgi:AcrR family transcriptional regulator